MGQNRRIKEIELAVKRGRLRERIGRQRDALATTTAPLSRFLTYGDHALHAVRWIKARPALVAFVATAIVVIRPRGTFRIVKRTFFIWQLLKKTKNFAARLL